MSPTPASDHAISHGVFHTGEILVQAKVGVLDEAEYIGKNFIRSFMPQQHSDFYGTLSLVFIGSEAADKAVWASVACGEPGHFHATSSTRLELQRTSISSNDPINLTVGSHLGMLGMELHTRRRNRINGVVVATANDDSLSPVVTIDIEQSFGNCPKYIQKRNINLKPSASSSSSFSSSSSSSPFSVSSSIFATDNFLPQQQKELVEKADTFFLATSAGREPIQGYPSSKGCDVSHRGGHSGFVKIGESDKGTTLSWPDYAGNHMFNSLGNLAANPICGLLFIDWLTGTTLQLTGTAVVDFDLRRLPGAERTVIFTVAAWRYAAMALPILPAPVTEISPYNPGVPADDVVQPRTEVNILSIKEECKDIKTFELSLPVGVDAETFFRAGQYATFEFTLDDKECNGRSSCQPAKKVTRTWTISSSPSETKGTKSFTITVKRVGVVTGYMHEKLVVGDKMAFCGVDGHLTPEYEMYKVPAKGGSYEGVLLIAGGIGVTPLKSIFAELVKRGISAKLIYSVKEVREAAFIKVFQDMVEKGNQSFSSSSSLSSKEDQEKKPLLFSLHVTETTAKAAKSSVSPCTTFSSGRITPSMIQEVAPDYAARDVFLCGPEPFMAAITDVFRNDLSHPRMDRIYTESFNF